MPQANVLVVVSSFVIVYHIVSYRIALFLLCIFIISTSQLQQCTTSLEAKRHTYSSIVSYRDRASASCCYLLAESSNCRRCTSSRTDSGTTVSIAVLPSEAATLSRRRRAPRVTRSKFPELQEGACDTKSRRNMSTSVYDSIVHASAMRLSDVMDAGVLESFSRIAAAASHAIRRAAYNCSDAT